MIHQRRQIRQAVVRALLQANTAARQHVYDHPWNERTALPALVVSDIGEQQRSAAIGMGASGVIERQYVFEVAAELQPLDDWGAQRDDLLASVEAAVLQGVAAFLPGRAVIEPAGYQADEALQASRPTVIGRQRFSVTYHTTATDPGVVA